MRAVRLLTRTSCLALIVSIGSVARPAVAQEQASAAETAAARALAVDGIKLAKAGQCAEAVDKLDRAEKLHHSAIVLAHLGECQVQLGKVLEGTELLRKVLREPLPPDASQALVQAYERAKEVLKEAKPRIAGLTVTLTGVPNDVQPTVSVDGAAVGAAVLGVELPQNPGEHSIEVTAPGFLKASARVRLAPGEKASVPLELRPDPDAPKPEPVADGNNGLQPVPGVEPLPPGPTGLSNEASSTGSSAKTWAYVSYGVGVVGLAVGLGFGRAAMQDKDSLELDCPNKVCHPDEEDRLDSARTKGTLATVGFGVAAAGLSLGTILLIVSGSDASAQTGNSVERRRPTAATARLRPRAFVGLGSVRLSADF